MKRSEKNASRANETRLPHPLSLTKTLGVAVVSACTLFGAEGLHHASAQAEASLLGSKLAVGSFVLDEPVCVASIEVTDASRVPDVALDNPEAVTLNIAEVDDYPYSGDTLHASSFDRLQSFASGYDYTIAHPYKSRTIPSLERAVTVGQVHELTDMYLSELGISLDSSPSSLAPGSMHPVFDARSIDARADLLEGWLEPQKMFMGRLVLAVSSIPIEVISVADLQHIRIVEYIDTGGAAGEDLSSAYDHDSGTLIIRYDVLDDLSSIVFKGLYASITTGAKINDCSGLQPLSTAIGGSQQLVGAEPASRVSVLDPALYHTLDLGAGSVDSAALAVIDAAAPGYADYVTHLALISR